MIFVEGKTIVVTGSGNVANIYAIEKATLKAGAKVVAMNDSTDMSTIRTESTGLVVKDIKEVVKRGVLVMYQRICYRAEVPPRPRIPNLEYQMWYPLPCFLLERAWS